MSCFRKKKKLLNMVVHFVHIIQIHHSYGVSDRIPDLNSQGWRYPQVAKYLSNSFIFIWANVWYFHRPPIGKYEITYVIKKIICSRYEWRLLRALFIGLLNCFYIWGYISINLAVQNIFRAEWWMNWIRNMSNSIKLINENYFWQHLEAWKTYALSSSSVE